VGGPVQRDRAEALGERRPYAVPVVAVVGGGVEQQQAGAGAELVEGEPTGAGWHGWHDRLPRAR
jgi:hypothetical protein